MTAAPPRPHWDPGQYLRYSGHRARPLHDLLARVPDLPRDPARVADLGCGPGGPTALLADRWPSARITGWDNSPRMLDAARPVAGPTSGGGELDFAAADLADWTPGESHDLIFSNAAFQWVPDHPASFPGWIAGLTPHGVLAFQVPGNFSAPSHRLLNELTGSPRWRSRLGHCARPVSPVLEPADYLRRLTALGCAVDAWESTYIQLLTGPDAVLDWMRGTALRPVLTALADDPAAEEAFLAEYGRALRTAYPAESHGTVFPFRRIFVVARKEQP